MKLNGNKGNTKYIEYNFDRFFSVGAPISLSLARSGPAAVGSGHVRAEQRHRTARTTQQAET